MNHMHWWRKILCVGEGHYTFVSMQIQTQSLNLLDEHGSGRVGTTPTSNRFGGGGHVPLVPPCFCHL